jgi:CRISPR/Cas system CSM-associated protein Csm3 (group 7 of RAMP superfamily)
MYNDRLYADGVHSVLLAEWEMLCSTPLVIRNGYQIAYTDSAKNKTRYHNLNLKWRNKENQEYEVSSLYYGYEICNGQVCSFHFVSPNSIRGALRSWSIRNFVLPDLYLAMNPASSKDEDAVASHKACVMKGLARSDTGCELIASLFGLAADEGESDMPSNAGRLTIETERFTETGLCPVDVGGASMITTGGPGNVRREMTARNPLDRMTHASVDGGLHRFLEVARGARFKVHLRIINPLDCDLGLLGLWVRELNDGMLRIGGLSSIGRGRMEVKKQAYNLWRRPNAPKLQGHALIGEEVSSNNSNDIMDGIWAHYVVSPEALPGFADYLKDFTGGCDIASLS